MTIVYIDTQILEPNHDDTQVLNCDSYYFYNVSSVSILVDPAGSRLGDKACRPPRMDRCHTRFGSEVFHLAYCCRLYYLHLSSELSISSCLFMFTRPLSCLLSRC